MSILFYVIKKNHDHSRDMFYQFILEFSKQANERLIVIDENASHALATHPLEANKNISIIDFDELVNGWTSQLEGNLDSRSFNYLNILEKLPGDQITEKNSECGRKLFYLIGDLIAKNDVRAAHLCVFFEMFRSVGAVVLQEVMTAKNIPFYMIHRTNFKGRFCIYTNIYFGLQNVESCYSDTLRLGVDEARRAELDRYFSSYLSFTNTTHRQHFQKNREVKKKFFSRQFIGLVKRQLLSRRTYLPKKYTKYRNPNRPYILFLLNKVNHWITSYANPELYNRDYVIRTVWLNIPSNYDLVLKPHPDSSYDHELAEIADDLANCYVEFEQISSVDLVSRASVVIFSATTSAIIALASKKHVVELGRQSIYFDFPNPPAKRAQNLMDLGGIIKECLNEEPPVDRIYAYFHAWLKHSYPLVDNGQEVTLDVPSDLYKRAARRLVDQMRKDEVCK